LGDNLYAGQNQSIALLPLSASGNALATGLFVDLDGNIAIFGGEIYAVVSNGDIRIISTNLMMPDVRSLLSRDTGLLDPTGITVDQGTLFVGDGASIHALRETSPGVVMRLRTIIGPHTGLGTTDQLTTFNGELYVADPFAGSVHVYPTDADFDAAPSR